eukprot:550313-Amphidinium_carterae.1
MRSVSKGDVTKDSSYPCVSSGHVGREVGGRVLRTDKSVPKQSARKVISSVFFQNVTPQNHSETEDLPPRAPPLPNPK